MKQIILDIPDNKLPFFMELVNNLGFVKKINTIGESASDDLIIPEWHKEVVRERRKNAKRKDYTNWNTLEKKLDKKYGVK